MLSMAALNREPVTEAHTKMCAERGHATHTVNGVAQGTCPRCGEVKIISDGILENVDRVGHNVRVINYADGSTTVMAV